jgi:hypothetical protein
MGALKDKYYESLVVTTYVNSIQGRRITASGLMQACSVVVSRAVRVSDRGLKKKK